MPFDGPSIGIDRRTGKVLTGFDHVLQSVETIFTTMVGERVMRRQFGSSGAALLGRLMTAANVLRFFSLIAVALDLWEPRFRIVKVTVPPGVSIDDVRRGRLTLLIDGQYRPRGHLGDPT